MPKVKLACPSHVSQQLILVHFSLRDLKLWFDVVLGTRPWLREYMYNHYQGEKYASWYALPEEPLKKGDVLYTAKDSGAFVWDGEGKMLFQTGEATVKADRPER